jgi:hypothetical protein
LPVADTPRRRLHEFAVRDAVEIPAQVRVHDLPMAAVEQPLDLALLASRALRPWRSAYCSGCKSGSKIGSKTSKAAIGTTRSLIVGIPNGRSLPSAFGI